MSTTKPQLIWIYKHSPVAPGEIKSVKTVNSDGWYLTVDKKLIDPHWCCPVTDWQEYDGGFALFEQDTDRIVETRDIKKYLFEVGDWSDEVAIAAHVELSIPQVRIWLKNHRDLVESREVRNGCEWRIINLQNDNGSQNAKTGFGEISLPKVLSAFTNGDTNDNGSQIYANGAQNDNGSQKVNDSFTLNLDNAETLQDFEQLIRDNLPAYYIVGKALIEIRDRQLYIDLPDINTFEEYCQFPVTAHKLGIKSKRRAYQLIDAAQIIDVLKSEQFVHLPTNENQIRAIATLKSHDWKKAWQQAIDSSNRKPPTGTIVKDVVRQIKERITEQMKIENPYAKGDILIFFNNGDRTTLTRNKRWVIVKQVNEFTCTVSDFEGEFVAHINQLKKLELTPSEKQAAVVLCARLARIAPVHELAKIIIVNYFARLKQFSLSEKEEANLDLWDIRHDHKENSSF